jgi:hypothetical protein
MKKLLLAVACFFALSTVTNAQTKQTATDKAKTAKTEVKKDAAKPVDKTKKVVKHETDKVNKDGTPDKRFKENKTATTPAKPTGPTKKDGTPDMRYKENKKKS